MVRLLFLPRRVDKAGIDAMMSVLKENAGERS